MSESHNSRNASFNRAGHHTCRKYRSSAVMLQNDRTSNDEGHSWQATNLGFDPNEMIPSLLNAVSQEREEEIGLCLNRIDQMLPHISDKDQKKKERLVKFQEGLKEIQNKLPKLDPNCDECYKELQEKNMKVKHIVNVVGEFYTDHWRAQHPDEVRPKHSAK